MADHRFTAADDVIDATDPQVFGWADSIYGEEGNDTVRLGEGVTFVSGPGDDVVWGSGRSQYATWPVERAVRINLPGGWADDGFGGRDQLHGISHVHLSGWGGEVVGTAADEVVFVLGGDAALDLGGGKDTALIWGRNSADFTIRQTGTLLTVSAEGYLVRMRDVESIEFADATVAPVYKSGYVMQQKALLHRFTETERSPGYWYAGVYSEPQLVSYFPQASFPIDLDADGDQDVVVPLNRGYRTGVDTRYSFQVFENIGGELSYSAVLTAQAPFVAGARRSEKLMLERSQSELLVTIAHDTAIETETRTDLPWRYGDLTLTSVAPFAVVTSALVGGTGTVAAMESGRPTAVDAHSMAVGDIDGDGRDDLLVGDFSGVFALLQTQAGPFQRVSTPLMTMLNGWVDPSLPGATPGMLLDMALGDVNGDGLDDLVVGWGHATVRSRVFFNDRETGFTASDSVALPVSVYGADNALHMKTWIEDFDGDGDKDVLILQSRNEPYYGGNYLQLLINDGKGAFADETAARLGDPADSGDTFAARLQWTDYWQIVDVDKDGALDIVGGSMTTGDPLCYRNDGSGKFARIDVPLEGNATNVAWEDFDGDGWIESLAFDSTWVDDAGTSSINSFKTFELAFIEQPSNSRAYDLVGNAGIVARTLGAVFGPAAVHDPYYVGVGLALVDAGMGYDALLDLALSEALPNGRTDRAVVATLYTNVVGNPPTEGEIGYFLGQLASGAFDQVSLARHAADLDLNLANIDLVGLASRGLDYIAVA